MKILDKALDYLACPADGSDMGRRNGNYVCNACNSEYPIIDSTPCFSARPSDSIGDSYTLKKTTGEKASSNDNPAAEVSRLAKIYSPLGARKSILQLVSDGIEITKKYKLSGSQAAALQQAITEVRYDIEAPDYRGTFILPAEFLAYASNSRFAIEGACGPGDNLAFLNNVPFRLGVDISFEMARKSQKSFGSDELLFVQGDVCRLPVRGDSADAYMSFNALDRVPRLSMMSKEMKRVVSPGGVCILGACEPPQYDCKRNGVVITYVPKKERLTPEKMLKNAGCSYLGVKEFPWTVSTVLDGKEDLITAVYFGKRR